MGCCCASSWGSPTSPATGPSMRATVCICKQTVVGWYCVHVCVPVCACATVRVGGGSPTSPATGSSMRATVCVRMLLCARACVCATVCVCVQCFVCACLSWAALPGQPNICAGASTQWRHSHCNTPPPHTHTHTHSVMMIDEAHERTLHTDVLFGLVKVGGAGGAVCSLPLRFL